MSAPTILFMTSVRHYVKAIASVDFNKLDAETQKEIADVAERSIAAAEGKGKTPSESWTLMLGQMHRDIAVTCEQLHQENRLSEIVIPPAISGLDEPIA
jgi:hypothetical protein